MAKREESSLTALYSNSYLQAAHDGVLCRGLTCQGLTCHSKFRTCVMIFVSETRWCDTVRQLLLLLLLPQGLAFIKDPDGYWIEILNPAVSGALAAWKDE